MLPLHYTGNYDKFLELSAIHKSQQNNAYEKQQQEVAQFRRFYCPEQSPNFYYRQSKKPAKEIRKNGFNRKTQREN